MGKLVITDNIGVTTQFDLTAERVTIGRAAGNDVVLNDKATSGRHAAIVTILDDAFLEDLDSTNGTQVNGQPVTKHPLAHGDVITIGRNTLRYFTTDAGDAEMDKTMILRPGSIPPATPSTPPRASTPVIPALVGAGKPVLGKLHIASGSSQGREMELSKPLTTLGKPGVQVAAITRRAEGYYIVQVDSTGGRKLRINGADVDPQPRRLSHGDRVELAGTQIEFHIIG